MSASDEVGLSYGSSLEDLTFNSKPIINSLTMIAEELIDSAPSVVAVIEETLATRPADKKLPVMYLLDSICKNIGGAFVENFQVNLPETVLSPPREVDDKIGFACKPFTCALHPPAAHGAVL